MNPYKIRSAQAEDIPFLYSTWLKAMKYDSDIGLSVRKSIFFEQYRQILDNILSDSKVLLAVHPDEPNVIFGYLVYQEPNILHFSFVKETFRRLGIASDLVKIAMAGSPIYIMTHQTRFLNEIADNLRHYSLTHNPFLLYNKQTKE
jgi:hypothetical protein